MYNTSLYVYNIVRKKERKRPAYLCFLFSWNEIILWNPQNEVNCPIVEVIRDLGRLFCSTPFLSQSQLQQIPQDGVQLGFQYLHEVRDSSLSEQPVLVLSHPSQ